jgi:glutamyl-tRNA reductase
MWIAIVGFDHTTAPIELRERLACSPAQAREAMSVACRFTQECALLSTCNRVELCAVGPGRLEKDGIELLLRTLSQSCRVELAELQAHSYCYTGRAAVSHLFAVTCGLRSLVVGEPQIQGQVAEAYEFARQGGYSGPIVSALFRAAIVAGKRARSQTGISRSAASASHVAVQLARQLFPQLGEANILLIGSGQMGELAARNLRDNGAKRLVIINRTPQHAIELARRNAAAYRPLEELPAALVEADVVISSTNAPHTLLAVDMVKEALRRKGERDERGQGDREGAPVQYTSGNQGDREGAPVQYTNDTSDGPYIVRAHPRGRPGSTNMPQLLLIDIAMPRDVDPAVGTLPGVHLYNLDDLQAGVSQGIEQRAQEVEHVRAIIAEEVGAFERWLQTQRVVGAISELRQRADDLRRQELERTLRQLSSTLSEREVEAVQALSKSLVNKLLHTPTLRLKQAAVDDQGQAYAEAFQFLFNLEACYEEEYYDWDASEQAGDDPDLRGHRTAQAVMARAGDAG